MILSFIDHVLITLRAALLTSVEEILQNGENAMADGGPLSGQSTKVDELGGGSYHLIRKGGVYIILICVAVAGLGLVFAPAHERGEKKNSLIWKIVGAIIFFAAVAIVVMLETVGSGLFEATAG